MEENFINAVNDGDVIMARILLKGEVLVDPRLVRFREMQRLAEEKIADLYDIHDGESFEYSISEWTESLHGKIQKDLNKNFSKERLDYYARMAPVVLKSKVDELQKSDPINMATDFSGKSISNFSDEPVKQQRDSIRPKSQCGLEENFVKAVGDGDVIMVRILLKGEVLVDPRLARFREMQRLAETKMADLYDIHDGELFDYSISEWTESLHGRIQKDLNRNFSKERLDYYAQMAPLVLKSKVDELQKEDPINMEYEVSNNTSISKEGAKPQIDSAVYKSQCDIEENFVKAVEDGDVIMVRILLKGEVLVDPRLVRFREMQRLAEEKITDLYDIHDGESFGYSISEWTESLHGKIQKELNRNFSKERLDYYAQMAPVVLKSKVDELQQTDSINEEPVGTGYETDNREDEGNTIPKKEQNADPIPESNANQNKGNGNDSSKGGSEYQSTNKSQDTNQKFKKAIVVGLISLGLAILLSRLLS